MTPPPFSCSISFRFSPLPWCGDRDGDQISLSGKWMANLGVPCFVVRLPADFVSEPLIGDADGSDASASGRALTRKDTGMLKNNGVHSYWGGTA